MERQILHVDVNNAFLSWTAIEMLKNGSKLDIRTIPCIIGGDETTRRGIVLAKSMKAKEYGIVTAETIYSAKRKCPNLQVFSGLDYKKYKEYSNSLYQLLLEYTDKIERFSIDECFLDMTEFLQNDTLLNKAMEINRRVREELGFTVNVGVAHNKLLAKMASDFKKPDRVHTLFENEIQEKIWNMPISELFMLGKKTVPKLYNMGIKTIGELAKTDKNILTKKFGLHGALMWEYANGIDNSPVKYQVELPKSIGNSITLPMDIGRIEDLEKVLLALTEQVTFRLRRYKLLASVVNVQLRTNKFEDFSHQKKLDISTSNTKEIYTKAKELLYEMFQKGILIRLIGVKVDGLIGEDEVQLSMFSTSGTEKQDKLDKVVDNLKNKYGYNSITRAGSMNVDDIVKMIRKYE
ncbi:MAG: DNA polymerase IV [Clostridia bacterium]|nr:DNA polymerase IV [Clostridia bacterium]